MRFADRADAGRRLAQLVARRELVDPIVLALPRGGVPVGAEVAHVIGAPLEVFVVRKLGAPMQPELGVGAVTETGHVWVNRWLCERLGLEDDTIAELARREYGEARRRVRAYRGERALPDMQGRDVVLVDDGIATGATVEAGIEALRRIGVGRIVLATPVAAPEALERLGTLVDDVACVTAPDTLMAIGNWYESFPQCSDAEVVAALDQAAAGTAAREEAGTEAERAVRIDAGEVRLEGDLTIPTGARGLVVFAHGSGSGRKSPRNRSVARALQQAGLATLLFDLLTPEEAAIDAFDARYRFDIALLGERLSGAVGWAAREAALEGLGIGCFGSSTGAAAALVAAAERPEVVRAVVSRGGRPDLAMEVLERVRAPTLLVVGGRDREVLGMNRQALAEIGAPAKIEVVPGALEEVARLAAEWFVRFLPAAPGRAAGELRPDV